MIPWWVWPAAITVLVLAAGNWWPNPYTGYRGGAMAFFYMATALVVSLVVWVVVLVWRLNT